MAITLTPDRDSGKFNLRVCCEFGYDLQCAVPFANWLKSRGKLGMTIGPVGSASLYYFNVNNHIEDKNCERNDFHVPDQMNPHRIADFSQWLPPKYKDYYKNTVFLYDLPILIIHNKYAPEWHGPPINYLNIQDLEFLFSTLCNHYKVIYHRPKLNIEYDVEDKLNGYSSDKTERESLTKYEIPPFNDDIIVKKYNITTLQDLAKSNLAYTFNEVR